MKVVALAVLLQVGSGLALSLFDWSSTSSEPSTRAPDYVSSCVSSREYTQRQKDVAARLWRYDGASETSIEAPRQEYPAFRIAASYNVGQGGHPTLQLSLSTELLEGVGPGLCISSASESLENVDHDKTLDHGWLSLFSSAPKSKHRSSKTAPAPLLEVIHLKKFLGIREMILAVTEQAYEGAGARMLLQFVNLLEAIESIVASPLPEFVIHVIPPFPEVVNDRGPVLERLIAEARNMRIRSESENVFVFSELMIRVVIPQLLAEMAPVFFDYMNSVVFVPTKLVEQIIFELQNVINNVALPVLANQVLFVATEFVPQVVSVTSALVKELARFIPVARM